jgi:outer membrane lipoprotein-sorting protein
MKKILFYTVLTLFVFNASSQDAATILANLDKIMFSAKDKSGTVAIILIDKDGKEKVREAEMFQKGADKKLYRYTKPESQVATATLSLPGDVMWLYMPAFEKPKKISVLSRSQAFTGTDFSYEDMATTPYSDRFTPTLLKSDNTMHELELIPISEKSKYSKIILKVNQEFGYPISMSFYNERGKHFKEATYIYEKPGKYWNASEVVMKDLDKNHSTKIRLTHIKFDQGLSDEIFDVEKMKL